MRKIMLALVVAVLSSCLINGKSVMVQLAVPTVHVNGDAEVTPKTVHPVSMDPRISIQAAMW